MMDTEQNLFLKNAEKKISDPVVDDQSQFLSQDDINTMILNIGQVIIDQAEFRSQEYINQLILNMQQVIIEQNELLPQGDLNHITLKYQPAKADKIRIELQNEINQKIVDLGQTIIKITRLQSKEYISKMVLNMELGINEKKQFHSNNINDHKIVDVEQDKIKETQAPDYSVDEEKYINICPLTHLGNEIALKNMLAKRIEISIENIELLLISLDHTNQIRSEFGSEAGDELIIAAASHLRGIVPEVSRLFRIGDHEFAYLKYEPDEQDITVFSEIIRNSFPHSSSFIKPITVSIGGMKLIELKDEDLEINKLISKLLGEVHARVKHSKINGMNRSTVTPIMHYQDRDKPIILAVDDDPLQLELIRQSLSNLNIKIITSFDGDDALAQAKEKKPNLIICEIAVPKRDGLSLKRLLSEDPDLRDIPLLLMTQHKNINVLRQALDLNIIHVLEKPLFPTELEALAGSLLKLDIKK